MAQIPFAPRPVPHGVYVVSGQVQEERALMMEISGRLTATGPPRL